MTVPEEWVETDGDKSWEAILAVALSLAVSTLMVGLRIYTRRFMVKEMSKDDWAAIITLVRPFQQTYSKRPEIAISRRRTLTRAALDVCTRNYYRLL